MGYQTPDFPDKIWDGLSSNTSRESRQDNIDPNQHDWDKIVAEMLAVQNVVSTLGNPTGNPNVWNITASEDITISDLVFIQIDGTLKVADATLYPLVTGIALSSRSTGQLTDILTHGKYVNFDWSLTPGKPYYLGTMGTLSETPPTSGWVIEIGRAITTVGLSLEIRQPIKL